MNDAVNRWTTTSILNSINTKIAIILAIIVVGLISNIARTTMDIVGDSRQARIRYLDKRIIELETKLEACESGTAAPIITREK